MSNIIYFGNERELRILQYMYYKKMTQAAVLIQSQFRSYYAQKRFRQSREAATIIQNRYRAYKEHERFKKSRNAAVLIQQRFRSVGIPTAIDRM